MKPQGRWLALGVALISGCALPVPEGSELSSFVPERELRAVEISQQAMYDFNRNRYVDAELGFRQALYMYPGLENLRANLAASLERTGQFDEAAGIYKEMSERTPQSAAYMAGIARVRVASGDYRGGIEAYYQAYALAAVLGDAGLSANIARSVSALAFRIGDVETAECFAALTYSLRSSDDELKRYARLLLGDDQPGMAES
ncbi:MAG: hypothetical protein WCH98_23050, partial [Verrucomicrobiota bacterium]